MTLNEILTAALAQLDRGHDAQTLENYRVRLTQYANDAATRTCRCTRAVPHG